MTDTRFREITSVDLPVVCTLLTEGFPRRTRAYWQTGLDHLSARPRIEGFPQYGYVLEVDGAVQGVLLLLTSSIGGQVRSNVSSWYVREPHRNLASFMSQRATKTKGPVYTNLSPSPVARPIIEVFGFKAYTAGTLLLDPRSLLKPGGDRVGALGPRDMARFDAAARKVLQAHLDYGCTGLIIDGAEGPMAALYRIKMLKRTVRAARFVAGDPHRLVRSKASLMRNLLMRGIPVAMIDAPPDFPPSPGVTHMPEREIRFAKGGTALAPGDLLETEIAIFGP